MNSSRVWYQASINQTRVWQWAGVGIVVIGLIVLPRFLSPYWVSVVTNVLVFGLFAASIDLTTGYTGLPSLGHAAFFGMGAYSLAILLVKHGSNSPESFLLSIVAAVVMAALLAPMAIRVRGIYFLMITVALAQCIWAIASRWTSLTGGDDGITSIPRPELGISWWSLSQPIGFYFFVLGIVVVAMLALYRITKSPFGQTLVGIRENETRMASLGYNVWLHTYLVFIISGFFAGLSGILFAWHSAFISPEVLSITLSTEGLLMVVLGGIGTLWGPFLGAAVLYILKQLLSTITVHWPLILGPVLIVAVIFMPRGIAGRLRRRG